MTKSDFSSALVLLGMKRALEKPIPKASASSIDSDMYKQNLTGAREGEVDVPGQATKPELGLVHRHSAALFSSTRRIRAVLHHTEKID